MIDEPSHHPLPPGVSPADVLAPDADALTALRDDQLRRALKDDRFRTVALEMLLDGFVETQIFDAQGRGFIVLAKGPRGDEGTGIPVCEWGFQIHFNEAGDWWPCAGYVMGYDGANLYGKHMPTLEGTSLDAIDDWQPLGAGEKHVWLGIRGSVKRDGVFSTGSIIPFWIEAVEVNVTTDEPPDDGGDYDYLIKWATLPADRIEPVYSIAGHFAFVDYPPAGESSGSESDQNSFSTRSDGSAHSLLKGSESEDSGGSSSVIESVPKSAIVAETDEFGRTRYRRFHCIEAPGCPWFITPMEIVVAWRKGEVRMEFRVEAPIVFRRVVEPGTMQVWSAHALGSPMIVLATVAGNQVHLHLETPFPALAKPTAVRVLLAGVRKGMAALPLFATKAEFDANKLFWSTPQRWAGLPQETTSHETHLTP